jgi:hypothetical protein
LDEELGTEALLELVIDCELESRAYFRQHNDKGVLALVTMEQALVRALDRLLDSRTEHDE